MPAPVLAWLSVSGRPGRPHQSQHARSAHMPVDSDRPARPLAGRRPADPGDPRWRVLLESRWRARLLEVTELSLAYHDAAAAPALSDGPDARWAAATPAAEPGRRCPPGPGRHRRSTGPAGCWSLRPLRVLRSADPGRRPGAGPGSAVLPALRRHDLSGRPGRSWRCPHAARRGPPTARRGYPAARYAGRPPPRPDRGPSPAQARAPPSHLSGRLHCRPPASTAHASPVQSACRACVRDVEAGHDVLHLSTTSAAWPLH